ncbi:MAG: hypothetical protein GY786_04610, partial [Proteobacteria bacterium]|nr:hypothetical protein [Pseudomonadota bacterium]
MIIFRLLLLLVIMGCSLSLNASTSLTELLQLNKIYQVSFSQQKKIPFLKKPFHTSGQVIFHHKKGILWKTTKPLKQTLLITPSGFYTVNKGRVIESAMGEKSDLFYAQLFDFFRGDLSGIEKTFRIKTQQSDQDYKISLTPKGEILKEFLTRI